MGIVEENRNWAAHADRHGEAMYRLTKNPYYVVVAVAAARTVGWIAPEWAMNVLLDAVKAAYFSSQGVGTAVSIDAALGLKQGRGVTPPKLSAYRASEEAIAFEDIGLLRACFEVSIPDACELVYRETDFSFARHMSESISGRWSATDEDLKLLRLTRQEHEQIVAKSLARDEEIINDPRNNDQVRKKLRAGDYLSISTADRLGYSLDTFIEKYYRRDKSGPLKTDRKFELLNYLHGETLLSCGTTRYSSAGSVPIGMHDRRPLGKLALRASFIEFLGRRPSVLK